MAGTHAPVGIPPPEWAPLKVQVRGAHPRVEWKGGRLFRRTFATSYVEVAAGSQGIFQDHSVVHGQSYAYCVASGAPMDTDESTRECGEFAVVNVP